MTKIVIDLMNYTERQLNHFREIMADTYPDSRKDRLLIDSMIFENALDYYSEHHGGPCFEPSPSMSPSPSDDDEDEDYDYEINYGPYLDISKSNSVSPSPSPRPETLRGWIEKLRYDFVEWWERFLYD